MKSICFLSGYFNRYDLNNKSQGGAEFQNYLLKCELEKKGFTVFFISIGDKDEIYKDGKTIVFYIKKKRFSRKFGDNFFLYIPKIYKILKKISPDIIYQRVSLSWTGIAAYYAKKFNKKFIWAIGSEEDVVPFSFDKFQNVIFNFIDHQIANYGKKNCSTIIAQAEYQKKMLLSNYRLQVDAVIYNYHYYPEESLDKDNDNLKIIWVANFSDNKHPEWFVDIANQLKCFEDIQFTIIGRPFIGEKQNKIENAIQACNNIVYLGNLQQKEINILLAKTNILVNTSQVEGFSNVFIQAMLRKNVVLSLNSNPDNILNRFNCGYCSDGNLQNLIQYITMLHNNRDLLLTMSNNAYTYACNNHLIDNQIGKVLKFFN